MKLIVLLMLLGSYLCYAGACDTNVLALGDWSDPVANYYGAAIRGRLLLCDYPNHRGPTGGSDIAVYLELQEYSDYVGGPVELYCDMVGKTSASPEGYDGGLHCELRDGSGRRVPNSGFFFGGGAPTPCWVMLQPCGSVRLRASVYGGGKLSDGGLGLWFITAGSWTLKANDTNAYSLSGTFTVTPPTNHVPADFRYLWRGTLKLPPLKVSAKKA